MSDDRLVESYVPDDRLYPQKYRELVAQERARLKGLSPVMRTVAQFRIDAANELMRRTWQCRLCGGSMREIIRGRNSKTMQMMKVIRCDGCGLPATTQRLEAAVTTRA